MKHQVLGFVISAAVLGLFALCGVVMVKLVTHHL